jgi:hypothetical protein
VIELLKDVVATPDGPFAVEGRVYCRPFGRWIAFAVEDAASMDYVRRCAGHLDALPAATLDALCEASIRYCNGMRLLAGAAPLAFASARDVLPLIDPNTLLIPNERRPEPVVHLELNCDWEPEHGLEWIVRDGRVLYVGGFMGGNPWAEYDAKASWNFA